METGPTEILLETKATYSVICYLGRELPGCYQNIILVKWMRSLWELNDFFKLIPKDEFFASYQNYIKMILARPNSIIRLAVLTDEPDTCIGFSVSEPNILHYVWVHGFNRKIGVGAALTQFPFRYITHLTRVGMSIWNNKYKHVRFNPFK